MDKDMKSALPFLFILILTLNQNTLPPKKRNDEENELEKDKHEDNIEEKDATEENDATEDQKETDQDEDCCIEPQHMPNYQENGKSMKE